jgi:hypothetical protein
MMLERARNYGLAPKCRIGCSQKAEGSRLVAFDRPTSLTLCRAGPVVRLYNLYLPAIFVHGLDAGPTSNPTPSRTGVGLS